MNIGSTSRIFWDKRGSVPFPLPPLYSLYSRIYLPGSACVTRVESNTLLGSAIRVECFSAAAGTPPRHTGTDWTTPQIMIYPLITQNLHFNAGIRMRDIGWWESAGRSCANTDSGSPSLPGQCRASAGVMSTTSANAGWTPPPSSQKQNINPIYLIIP